MDRIKTPILRSKTLECPKCHAGWRIYEDDVVLGGKTWDKFWIECLDCGHLIGVGRVLSFAMKHAIELRRTRTVKQPGADAVP